MTAKKINPFLLTISIMLVIVTDLYAQPVSATRYPNIVLIYADDLGYGDLSCYGGSGVITPNIDRLAKRGLRFTNAYASSSTCTPSRYSLLTGVYPWRKAGTSIAPGDSPLIIDPTDITLASVLKQAGYKTGIVGKWHLGLGPRPQGPDWNNEIKPGPKELGFHYSFLIPATNDRVPCVYVENSRVVDLDPADPIIVSYREPVGNDPKGKEHPELLKLKFHHGHDQTIVNGISRIGYMSGGNSARWIDEDMSTVLTKKSVNFINENKGSPFFLMFSTPNIHVPRTPNKRFVGKTGMGARGDVIAELDWMTGEILKVLDSLKLTDNTMIIFSSDNGPVLNDGYVDGAVEMLNAHKPAGPLRGGKYSAFEAGSRIPMIVCWEGKIKPGLSRAVVSQVDFLATFAALTSQTLLPSQAVDSYNVLSSFQGENRKGRGHVVLLSLNNTRSIVKGDWKFIPPSKGPKVSEYTNVEMGNDSENQLYHLTDDIGEQRNLASQNIKIVEKMQHELKLVNGQKENNERNKFQ